MLLKVVTVLLLCGSFVLAQNFHQYNGSCIRIFADEQVIVESPGYPSGYPSNTKCSYIFKGPTCPTYFNFQFLDFHLVSSQGCVDDRLEIQDQDALCGIKSGIKSYFSDRGTLEARFISDANTFGRGFKILIERLPCNVKLKIPTASTDIARAVFTSPTLQTAPRFCCSTTYNERHFFLSSPGFLSGGNNPVDCVYNIYRANSNICRLRIHFLFFQSGLQTEGCTRSFFQVDGKFICGCRTGLKLTSVFDSRWGNLPKVFRYKNSGFTSNPISRGFLLEVIQDECPKRLSPTIKSTMTDSQRHPQFHFYKDQVNRIAWPFDSNDESIEIERAALVSENTEVQEDTYNSSSVTHFYIFDGTNTDTKPRDIEETTYIDTSLINFFLADDPYRKYMCQTLNEFDWRMIAEKIPSCEAPTNKPISLQCQETDYIRGYIQSQGYPHYYPGNINSCYRFKKSSGYCSIRIAFADFDLQNSFECRRDYISFRGNYRYCGRSLHKSVLTFDTSDNNFQELVFKSEGYYCGRGFKAIYEQIPCVHLNDPLNPPNPIYPTDPVPTVPSIPLLPCGGNIQNDNFLIEVYGNNQPRCSFLIQQGNSEYCRVTLKFLHFNLVCGYEQLIVNEKRYCGSISGQSSNVSFHNNDNKILIIYERTISDPTITGLRVRIVGTQISDGCEPYEYPNVPAERLHITTNRNANNKNAVDNAILQKDICGRASTYNTSTACGLANTRRIN